MEEFYIKKEKAYYSYKRGGCNVLWGTANEFGSGSPMKDPLARKKRSETGKEYYKTHPHPSLGRKASEETRRKLSESHKGKRLSQETINKIVSKNKGKKRSKEHCERMKKIHEERRKNGYVSPMRGHKWSEETKRKRSKSIAEYYATHNSAFKGKHHTEETKKKMSDSKRGSKNYNYGQKLSLETRQKMSKSAKLGWEKRRNKVTN